MKFHYKTLAQVLSNRKLSFMSEIMKNLRLEEGHRLKDMFRIRRSFTQIKT